MVSIRKRIASALQFNPSRVRLEGWAAAAGRLGSDPSFIVLDAGAGRAPYRHHFSAVTYETADFLGFGEQYGYAQTTYECDLAAIPVEDGRFDLVFCSQTLEHVPDPCAVLREFRRIVKPCGQVWISVPFFYAEHDAPYDFYRYTQYGLRYMAASAGFAVRSIEPLEGYYATLSYQLQIASRQLSAAWLPLRAFFAVLSVTFGRLELSRPRRDVGICKNYCCVLTPSAAADG